MISNASAWPEDAFYQSKHPYPFPDWERLADQVERSQAPESRHAAWCDLAFLWMEKVRDVLPSGYSLHESANFILLSRADRTKASELLLHLEKTNGKIKAALGPLLPGKLQGKCPAILFSEENQFYDYVSMFFEEEEGSFGGMSGVYLNRGYGHFAMPSPDLARYAAVFAHELCHAYLSHLPLPLWLNEAITAGVEDAVEGSAPYHLNREIIARHRAYWSPESIADFWEGHSFCYPDEGQELSYHLARFILQALYRGGETPKEVMDAFFLEANYIDAGEAAAREILGISLGDCVSASLGEGSYEPRS